MWEVLKSEFVIVIIPVYVRKHKVFCERNWKIG